MAFIKLDIKKVRSLPPRSSIRISFLDSGNRVNGFISFAPNKRKIIKAKKFTILLYNEKEKLNKDFIFEQKRRVKKLNHSKRFPITTFL